MLRIVSFIRTAFGVNEIAEILVSIDLRLANLEGCVRDLPRHGNKNKYIATGPKYD